MDHLGAKRATAVRLLAGPGPLLIAVSGGVDSGVLLALAVEAVGRDRVTAVTGRSPSLAAADLEDARAVARHLGVPHRVVDTSEMSRAGYRANAGDRCYHCRVELFEVLDALARDAGDARIAYGAILDDLGDDRPGMRAARERDILAPLLAAGIGKREVRALAAEAGLPVRDKPAAACLASRLPVGTRVTVGRLRRVERAEAALRDLGFGQLRVRFRGETGRVELDGAGLDRIADPALRTRVVAAVKGAGFDEVEIDPAGYRTGGADPARRQRTGPNRESGQ